MASRARSTGATTAGSSISRPGSAATRISRRIGTISAWPLCAALAACAPGDDPAATVTATDLVDSGINTSVYECRPADIEAFEFTVRRGAAELALWLPAQFSRPYLVLSERYITTFDGRDMFTGEFRESDVALDLADADVELIVGERQFSGCRENRLRSVWEHAKLSGVNFRATGEDPAWYLEIRDGDRLDFRSARDPGLLTLPMTAIRLESGAAGASYRSTGPEPEFVAEISATPCTATDGLGLSGVTVVVTAGGRRFGGCGRPLH